MSVDRQPASFAATHPRQRNWPRMKVSKRQIGLATATALVLGNMIGSGVFLLPATLAPFGAWSLVGWVVSAIGALMLIGVPLYVWQKQHAQGKHTVKPELAPGVIRATREVSLASTAVPAMQGIIEQDRGLP